MSTSPRILDVLRAGVPAPEHRRMMLRGGGTVKGGQTSARERKRKSGALGAGIRI